MERIGVIGAGIICGEHIEAIDAREDLMLAAVCDIVPERAQRFTQPRGIPAFTDYKRMLDECPMEHVIINLPHKLHLECAVYCADRGVNILLEKPMAVSVEDCDAIIGAAQKNNVTLMIAHVQQYASNYREAKRIIESGELGRVVSIYDLRTGDYFREGRPAWFLQPEMSGGGIAINLGAHTLDRLHYLTGSRVVNAYGRAKYHDPKARVETNLSAFFEMENGVLATITLVGTQVPVHNETTVFLERGMLRMRFSDLYVSRGEGEPEAVELTRTKPMTLQLDDFLAAAHGVRDVAIPGAYGREIIRIVTQLYAQSSR